MLSSAKKLMMMMMMIMHCNGYCSATLSMLTCIGLLHRLQLQLQLELGLASSQQVSSNTSTASCREAPPALSSSVTVHRPVCLGLATSPAPGLLKWLPVLRMQITLATMF